MNEPLDNAGVSRTVNLAMNPLEGEPFSLADKHFTRRFLTMQAEQALTTHVVALMKTVKDGIDVAVLFTVSASQLAEMAAIVLMDQDPECTAEWLQNTRGITTNKLVDIVWAQLQLNEVIASLGKLLSIAALAGAMSEQRTPSPTP